MLLLANVLLRTDTAIAPARTPADGEHNARILACARFCRRWSVRACPTCACMDQANVPAQWSSPSAHFTRVKTVRTRGSPHAVACVDWASVRPLGTGVGRSAWYSPLAALTASICIPRHNASVDVEGRGHGTCAEPTVFAGASVSGDTASTLRPCSPNGGRCWRNPGVCCRDRRLQHVPDRSQRRLLHVSERVRAGCANTPIYRNAPCADTLCSFGFDQPMLPVKLHVASVNASVELDAY